MAQNESNLPIVRPNPKLNRPDEKRLTRKQQMVAQLASRGFETVVIAEEVGLTPNRVRQILRTEDVITEISRLVAERFEEGDRLLPTLYQTALAKLCQHLENPNLGVQARAIEKVLRFYEPQGDRSRPVVAQFFTGTRAPQGEKEESLDSLILRKRKERGLPND